MNASISSAIITMDRRHFIRIAGGGAVFAAIAPVAGCSSALPPEAIAAWNPPAETADVRHWLLAHAILAPHSHNLQSWLVDLSIPNAVVLYLDRSRLLPETDPYSRQMLMSQGTFLALFDMAARQRGLEARITLFPEGVFDERTVDGRPTARIDLLPSSAARPDPLFPQIFRRHTNREAYAPRHPSAEAIAAIRESQVGYDLRLGFTTVEDPALSHHREIAKNAWRIELETPRTLMESYRVLRVGPREIAEHRDGISINDPMVRALTALGLFDRTQPSQPGDSAIEGQIKDFNRKLDTTPAFFWMISPDNRRPTQVMAGMAYVRAQLAATAHGLSMHPLQQALQEYPEQAQPHAAIRQLLGAGEGETVQMWGRMGYGPAVDPSPRRGVASHLKKA